MFCVKYDELNSAMIDWAVSQLLQGKKSQSLYLLAGMSKNDNYFDVEDYFFKSIKELDLILSTEEKAIEEFIVPQVHEVCAQIVNNEISPINGSQKLEHLYDIAVTRMKKDISAWYIINMRYGLQLEKLDAVTLKDFEDEVRQSAAAFLKNESVRIIDGPNGQWRWSWQKK